MSRIYNYTSLVVHITMSIYNPIILITASYGSIYFSIFGSIEESLYAQSIAIIMIIGCGFYNE